MSAIQVVVWLSKDRQKRLGKETRKGFRLGRETKKGTRLEKVDHVSCRYQPTLDQYIGIESVNSQLI